jgi:hypothetical protein
VVLEQPAATAPISSLDDLDRLRQSAVAPRRHGADPAGLAVLAEGIPGKESRRPRRSDKRRSRCGWGVLIGTQRRREPRLRSRTGAQAPQGPRHSYLPYGLWKAARLARDAFARLTKALAQMTAAGRTCTPASVLLRRPSQTSDGRRPGHAADDSYRSRMGAIEVNVPATAGNSERWGEWAILRQPPQETVVLNLSRVKFADPLFLLRIRGFIDWHCHNGHGVRVVAPRSAAVRNYLSRMQLDEEVPPNCDCNLRKVASTSRDDVLIPIRRLGSQRDSDALDDELAALLDAQFTGDLAGLGEAFTRTVSEMCDNATTHGWSEVGHAYITAQRYKRGRCVLAIGDLGIGIPAHLRRAFPDLTDDGDAIREASKEGITATGSPHRGIGYQWVIDGLKETAVPCGELRVWSGRGRFRVEVRDGIQVRRDAWTVEGQTVGTWVRLELSAQ